MTQSVIDFVISIIGTFSSFFEFMSIKLNDLTGTTYFPDNMTLLSIMFGASFFIFVSITLLKWILAIVR